MKSLIFSRILISPQTPNAASHTPMLDPSVLEGVAVGLPECPAGRATRVGPGAAAGTLRHRAQQTQLGLANPRVFPDSFGDDFR